MWAVNNPPRARKPMTSTAPAVVLNTASSNQLLSRRVSHDFIELTVTLCTVSPETLRICQSIRCTTHRADVRNSRIVTVERFMSLNAIARSLEGGGCDGLASGDSKSSTRAVGECDLKPYLA